MFEYERSSLKSTVTLAKYITATVIWVVLLLTQAFMWDQGRLSKANFLENNSKFSLLDNVSISLVRTATHEFHPANQSFSYQALRIQDEIKKPWLVRNVGKTLLKGDMFQATYFCDEDLTLFQPPVCNVIDHTRKLKFTFQFYQSPEHFNVKPLGEINYNYGIVSQGNNNTEICTPSKHDLQDMWHLRYYSFKVIKNMFDDFTEIYKPWKKVCITPYLKYNQDISVCDGSR